MEGQADPQHSASHAGDRDPRGKPKSDSIEAVARVLDKSEALAVQRAVNKRYGILGWAFGVYMKLRGLDKKSVGVELKAA